MRILLQFYYLMTFCENLQKKESVCGIFKFLKICLARKTVCTSDKLLKIKCELSYMPQNQMGWWLQISV